MIKLKYRNENFKFEEVEVKPTMFPDGTSQVWKLSIFEEGGILRYTDCEITWNFENESELIHLAQLNDLLQQNGHKTTLIMPYMPYARQDKEISNGTTFALFSFNKLIKAIGFNKVKVFDVHNTEFLPNFIENMVPYNLLSLTEKLKPNFIFFPDHGAYARYSTMFENMGMEHFYFNKIPHIIGNKTRNPSTGEILKYEISPNQPKGQDPVDMEGKNCLIVDDLSDLGGTFIKAYDLLKENKVIDIHLYISHNIQNKGLIRLNDHGFKSVTFYNNLGK